MTRDQYQWGLGSDTEATMSHETGDREMMGKMAEEAKDLAGRLADELCVMLVFDPIRGSVTAERTMSHEAVELTLYAQNDYGAYRAYILPMLLACQKHYDKGQGDYDRMVKGFQRVLAPVARQYILEHGSMVDRWSSVFPVSVRREVAEHLAEYFLGEYRLGNRWSA